MPLLEKVMTTLLEKPKTFCSGVEAGMLVWVGCGLFAGSSPIRESVKLRGVKRPFVTTTV